MVTMDEMVNHCFKNGTFCIFWLILSSIRHLVCFPYFTSTFFPLRM